MMMMMMMTMMTYTIPYRRTKTHIWDKVLMGIWVHPMMMMTKLLKMMMRLMMKMFLVASTDDGDDYKYNDAVKTHSMTTDHTATKTA